jgi:hypothetical protein
MVKGCYDSAVEKQEADGFIVLSVVLLRSVLLALMSSSTHVIFGPVVASSVRWIKTQDLFFEQYKFEGFIEVGPSLTLTGMTIRTLKAKYKTNDDSFGHVRWAFCASKNQKEIYYQFEDKPEATSESDAPTEAANPAPALVAAAPVVIAPLPLPVLLPTLRISQFMPSSSATTAAALQTLPAMSQCRV